MLQLFSNITKKTLLEFFSPNLYLQELKYWVEILWNQIKAEGLSGSKYFFILF